MLCLNENFPQLVAQAPNVTWGFTPAGISVSRQGGHRVNQNISVVGMRGTSNNCTLDGGVADTDPDFNVYIRISSIDALQEFKVVSGIYPAEFGREAAQINVSAKSGTNDFRVPSRHRSRREAVSTSLLPVLQKLPCTQTVWRLRRRYAQDNAQAGAHRRLAMGNDPALARYDAEHDQIQYASPQGAQASPIRYPVFVRAGTHG